MVVNLIAIILGIVLIACFAGFNLDNKCDVNLLFHTFKDTPVFFTILISFAVGMLSALPFAFIHRAKKARKIKAEKKNKSEQKDLSADASEVQKAKTEEKTADEAVTSEIDNGTPV